MTGPTQASTVRTRRDLSLPGHPSSASAAREAVREALAAADRRQWAEATELACTEVVSNVVLHAHSDLVLTVEVFDDAVHVQVRDFSPALPVQRDYGQQSLTGRGMALVAALATDHGVTDVGPDGKTVWFTVTGDAAEQSEEELLAGWDNADWDLGELLDDVDAAPRTATQELRTVQLREFPVPLWLAAREHHDALVRELGLHLAQHGPGDLEVDVPATDRARATVSCAVASLVERAPRAGPVADEHPGSPGDVPERAELELHLAEELVACFAAMRTTLDAAERLARAELLLVRPGLPEIIAVRDWVCEQVAAQAAGAPPSAWPGADQERFTVADQDAVSPSEGWDIELVRSSSRGVVAADDANRIVAVSRPLADALGWAVEDLVGRRVVTIVPRRLREAHIAGFTRHLTTGEARVLGVPLTVPVLRADGTEVQARLLVETAPAAAGRVVYLAWLQPLDDGAD